MNETRKPDMHFEASDEYLSLKESLRVVKRRLWAIVLVILVSLAIAMGLIAFQTPQYEASVKILVGQEDAGTNLGGYVTGLQQLTVTLAEAVESRPVAETVIQELDLDITPGEFLEEHLSVEQIEETQFVQIDYRTSDPETAQQAANAVGEVFSDRIAELSPDAEGITATVWEPAVAPESPIYPNPVRYALLALVLGGILGLGLAFLLEYLDEGWNYPREVEETLGLPAFGVIPNYKAPRNKRKD